MGLKSIRFQTELREQMRLSRNSAPATEKTLLAADLH
jgi:hypothetical protein